MNRIRQLFEWVDDRIVTFMATYAIPFLRISLGVSFLWFGALKFFPGLSPAQELATETMSILTFGILTPEISILLLAIWESLIGIGLIFGIYLRITLLLLFVQMLGTLTPLFLFPAETFTLVPIAPTLEGQYILKNLVLISAGLVVGATVRGGRIVKSPDDSEA